MDAQVDTRVHDTIVTVVIDMLDAEGFDGVRLRDVASQARVSLATIYKLFGTRDELIVAALGRWLAENGYADLAEPDDGETLFEGLMRIFRRVFEPWEQHPRMLEAFHRARVGPGGERLQRQGMTAVEPIARAMLAKTDPALAADIEVVLTTMVYGVVGRFTDGDIAITDMLPILERATYRLALTEEVRPPVSRIPS
jgi:TetR/AcrR family transcriptional regulator, cholesterol catabolism regulator